MYTWSVELKNDGWTYIIKKGKKKIVYKSESFISKDQCEISADECCDYMKMEFGKIDQEHQRRRDQNRSKKRDLNDILYERAKAFFEFPQGK